MAESILYRDHLIVVTAQFNHATKSWIGRADVRKSDNAENQLPKDRLCIRLFAILISASAKSHVSLGALAGAI